MILQIIMIFFAVALVFTSGNLINALSTPKVKDDRLKITPLVTGLKLPTAMDFLAENDILVLEKDNGTIRRVVNGSILKNHY